MKILHFQIPVNFDRGIKDDFGISPERLGQFLRFIKKQVGEDYCIIASPMSPSALDFDGETQVFNFDMKQISIEELIELIKE